MVQFGSLLAELRQDQSMTRKELAEVLHVTAGTISNYENGVHLPDAEKLIDLANYFQVTTDYLLCRCCCRPPRPMPPSDLSWPPVLSPLAVEKITEAKNLDFGGSPEAHGQYAANAYREVLSSRNQ